MANNNGRIKYYMDKNTSRSKKNEHAQAMAHARWDGKTEKEKKEYMTRIAKMPRKPKSKRK